MKNVPGTMLIPFGCDEECAGRHVDSICCCNAVAEDGLVTEQAVRLGFVDQLREAVSIYTTKWQEHDDAASTQT